MQTAFFQMALERHVEDDWFDSPISRMASFVWDKTISNHCLKDITLIMWQHPGEDGVVKYV